MISALMKSFLIFYMSDVFFFLGGGGLNIVSLFYFNFICLATLTMHTIARQVYIIILLVKDN